MRVSGDKIIDKMGDFMLLPTLLTGGYSKPIRVIGSLVNVVWIIPAMFIGLPVITIAMLFILIEEA